MIEREAWYRSGAAPSEDVAQAERELRRDPTSVDAWHRYLPAVERAGLKPDSQLFQQAEKETVEQLGRDGLVELEWTVGGKQNRDPLQACWDATSNKVERVILLQGRSNGSVVYYEDAGDLFRTFARNRAYKVLNKWDPPAPQVVVDYFRTGDESKRAAARAAARAASGDAARAAWAARAAYRAAYWAAAWSASWSASRAAAAWAAAEAGGPSEEESSKILERVLIEGPQVLTW